jgi:hypothetical protein
MSKNNQLIKDLEARIEYYVSIINSTNDNVIRGRYNDYIRNCRKKIDELKLNSDNEEDKKETIPRIDIPSVADRDDVIARVINSFSEPITSIEI